MYKLFIVMFLNSVNSIKKIILGVNARNFTKISKKDKKCNMYEGQFKKYEDFCRSYVIYVI